MIRTKESQRHHLPRRHKSIINFRFVSRATVIEDEDLEITGEPLHSSQADASGDGNAGDDDWIHFFPGPYLPVRAPVTHHLDAPIVYT